MKNPPPDTLVESINFCPNMLEGIWQRSFSGSFSCFSGPYDHKVNSPFLATMSLVTSLKSGYGLSSEPGGFIPSDIILAMMALISIDESPPGSSADTAVPMHETAKLNNNMRANIIILLLKGSLQTQPGCTARLPGIQLDHTAAPRA